ncbi:MAG: hypothetical protein D6732_15710 [Methanobacteriota archaeon]|nr:MAG: hypothetical protein D6732_15710 [Euryarchaeota archaeon]
MSNRYKIALHNFQYLDGIALSLFLTTVIGYFLPFAEITASSNLGSKEYRVYLFKIETTDGKLGEISDILMFFSLLVLGTSALYLVLQVTPFGEGFIPKFLVTWSSIFFLFQVFLVSSNIDSLFHEPWYLSQGQFSYFQSIYTVTVSFAFTYYITWVTVFVILFTPFKGFFVSTARLVLKFISKRKNPEGIVT